MHCSNNEFISDVLYWPLPYRFTQDKTISVVHPFPSIILGWVHHDIPYLGSLTKILLPMQSIKLLAFLCRVTPSDLIRNQPLLTFNTFIPDFPTDKVLSVFTILLTLPLEFSTAFENVLRIAFRSAKSVICWHFCHNVSIKASFLAASGINRLRC